MGVLFVSTLLIALLPVLSTGLLQLVLGPGLMLGPVR
jgi:hypothetical protein